MLTNRYRVTTNGFRFRIQRLNVDIRDVIELWATIIKQNPMGWARNLIISLLSPTYFTAEHRAMQKWLLCLEEEHRVPPKRVVWTEQPDLFTNYQVKEFSSSFEAYQWIKTLNEEAEILTPEFQAIDSQGSSSKRP